MKDKLEKVLDKLQCLCGEASEEGHIEADGLLEKTVRLLSAEQDQEIQDLANRIVEAYCMVGKWYA